VVVAVITSEPRQLATISCETTALTTLPDALLDDNTISPLAKMAYWYLKRHGGRTSVKGLADAMETHLEIARKWLADLYRAGWLCTLDGGTDDYAVIQFTVHEVAVTVP
jgi:hypothetical protein